MKRAFSLIELSIVLVVLGLLVGGILSGRALIRASELRSVATEYQKYRTAVHSFRDKYFQLPADINNATRFWGSAGGTGSDAACHDTLQSATATCNGNGDGEIYAVATSSGEPFLIWKHLANAGLIEGQYPGTSAANGGYTSPYLYNTAIMPGWNTPKSKLTRGLWTATNIGHANAALQKFYGAYPADARPYYRNSLLLFDQGNDPYSGTGGPLAPDEAWNIDSKVDDGKPGSGKIEALRGGNATTAGNCLTHYDPVQALYDTSRTSGGSCAIAFVNAMQ